MQRTILLFVTALFSLTLRGWAQDTATIVGTVTDRSGAVIPDVKVTVSNPEKGFDRELQTNSAGDYTAAKVPIGNFVVTAEKSGFQRFVHTGITLAVGQTQRIDFQLTVGQVTQQVTHMSRQKQRRFPTS